MIKTIPIASLIMTKEEIAAAVSNIARGHPAVAEGPVEVVDMGEGQYQLVNGYHRLIAVMLRGGLSALATVNVSRGVKPWGMPSDRFEFVPELPYKGLEEIIEPYILKRLL